MIEKEIKLKLISPRLSDLRAKLLNEGKKIYDVEHQVDIYYNSIYRNFKETDEAVRIRVVEKNNNNKYVELTYKGPKLSHNIKSREELTVKLDYIQLDDIRKILEKLGLKEVMRVEKTRESFLIDNYYISLDYVDKLGEFIEIESASPDIDEKALQNFVNNFVKRYEINAEQTLKSYLELLIERYAKL